jgi:hypothetical protein
MLHAALKLEGWHFNHKKAHRLYGEEKLALRKKNKKRLKCEKRGVVEEARRGYQTGTTVDDGLYLRHFG